MMVQQEKYVGLATVYVAHNMLRAMVVRGALESAGIPVMLSYETLGPARELTVQGTGQVDVMVPIEWEDEATSLLNATPPSGELFSVPPDVSKETNS